MDLPKNLRRILAHKGMTVVRLSRLSQVPSKTIYHWMGGQKPRNVEQILKISQTLGVSVEEIFGLPMPSQNALQQYKDEINAGVFEVVLRRTSPRESASPQAEL